MKKTHFFKRVETGLRRSQEKKLRGECFAPFALVMWIAIQETLVWTLLKEVQSTTHVWQAHAALVVPTGQFAVLTRIANQDISALAWQAQAAFAQKTTVFTGKLACVGYMSPTCGAKHSPDEFVGLINWSDTSLKSTSAA